MRGIIYDGKRLQLTDALSVRSPSTGEVRLRVLRSGICKSDLNAFDSGSFPAPAIFGHEAAGEIIELGEGVHDFAVGDRVMVGTGTPCGTCRECGRGATELCEAAWGGRQQPFEWLGRPTYSFANVSSFAGEIVVRARQLYRTGDLPPEQAALIGCAVSTGYGAARILGRAATGDRVAVLGAGGVGINAIAAARVAGAQILAVDVNPDKEAPARAAGAEAFLLVNRDMDGKALADAVRAAFAPIDIAIECGGAPMLAEAAIAVVKRGGRVVLIGQGKPGATARLDLDAVTGGREIVGAFNGGTRAERDFPELIRLAGDRRIDLAAQVTQVWSLAHFEEAIAALRAGQVTRAVLDHTT